MTESKWAEVYRNQTDALERKDIVIEQYKALLRRYQTDHNRACAAMERDCECELCREAERITT